MMAREGGGAGAGAGGQEVTRASEGINMVRQAGTNTNTHGCEGRCSAELSQYSACSRTRGRREDKRTNHWEGMWGGGTHWPYLPQVLHNTALLRYCRSRPQVLKDQNQSFVFPGE